MVEVNIYWYLVLGCDLFSVGGVNEVRLLCYIMGKANYFQQHIGFAFGAS